ncbi:MAG: hypothetical protein J7L54_01160 [Elusimicrobia bacterium]|nr:hypothetical protein [Elusimicrobiota bacterium]
MCGKSGLNEESQKHIGQIWATKDRIKEGKRKRWMVSKYNRYIYITVFSKREITVCF